MTENQAFRFGFLMQCAEEDLNEVETRDRMEKAACMLKLAVDPFGALSRLLSSGVDLAGKAIAPVANMGATALLAGPPLAGIGGGYLLSQMNNDTANPLKVDDATDEAQRDEELAELYRAIDQLEQAERRRKQAA